MEKKYSNSEIEKKTIERINNLFYGNTNNISVNLSENDKTEDTDGQIRYNQKSFDVQCKGSNKESNNLIKNKYFNYINKNNLIYFYCINVFDDKNIEIYYKIFTTKEFLKDVIYKNYKSFTYKISTEKKTGSKNTKYISFKKYNSEHFLNEIKNLYTEELPVKKVEKFSDFFSDIQNKKDELIIKISEKGKFGEYELTALSKVVEEDDKIFKKEMPVKNIQIQINKKDDIIKKFNDEKGLIAGIINEKEEEIEVEGKKFKIKYEVDILKKIKISIGKNEIIVEKLEIKEDKMDVSFNYEIPYETIDDIESLENFILYFQKNVYEVSKNSNKDILDVVNNLKQYLKDVKKFNEWLKKEELEFNHLWNKELNKGQYMKNLYELYTKKIEAKNELKFYEINPQSYLLFLKLEKDNEWKNIKLLGNVSIKWGDSNENNEIRGDYFLIYLFKVENDILNEVNYKIINVDIRENVIKNLESDKIEKLPAFHRTRIILLGIGFYIYFKDKKIYEMLEIELNKNKEDNIDFLNLMQLKKHKSMTENYMEEDENRLAELKKHENAEIALGASILLEDNYSVRKIYKKLSEEQKKEFKRYPIYKFVDSSVLL